MKDIYKDEFIKLTHDEKTKTLITVWSNDNQNLLDIEVKEYYSKAHALIKQIESRFLLIDSRKRTLVYNLNLQQWIAEISQKFIINTGIEKIAILIPEETIASFSTTQLIDEIKAKNEHNVPFIKEFISIKEAFAWFKT